MNIDWKSIPRADQLAIIEQLTGPLKHVSATRGGELGHIPCPFCGGKDRFFVQPNHSDRLHWFCRKCTEGGGDVIDFMQQQGKTFDEAVGILGARRDNNGKQPSMVFNYTDHLRVVRYEPKSYVPQRKIDGLWVNGLGNRTDWPLYHETDVKSADPDDWILFVEGEKTADAIRDMGFTVVAIPGGANIARSNWQPQWAETLADRLVAILGDCDAPGAKFANDVQQQLQGIAAEVKIIDLPGLQPGEDPEDWRRRGGTVGQLQHLLIKPAAARPSKWLTPRQMKALPQVTFLIHDLLPENSLALLYGPSESGKSFLALDWAATLASQGKAVLYFALEGIIGMGNKRIPAWELQHGQEIPDNLLTTSEAINLLDEVQLAQLLNTSADVKPALIVFDTMSYMLGMAGCDENSASDIGRFLAACQRITREAGCTVLLLHHPTKDGKWERGSGALRGACDAIIEVTNSDGYITLRCSKSKDSAAFNDKHLQLIPIEAADSCVLVEANRVIYQKDRPLTRNEQAALNVLSWANFIEVGAMSKVISEEAGVDYRNIRRVMKRLMELELVTQGDKGEPYRLTEAGRHATVVTVS